MKPGKKTQNKLNARIKGHSDAMAELRRKNKSVPDGSWKMPGSRNRGKG